MNIKGFKSSVELYLKSNEAVGILKSLKPKIGYEHYFDIELNSLIKYTEMLNYNAVHWSGLKRPKTNHNSDFNDYKKRLCSYLNSAIEYLSE